MKKAILKQAKNSSTSRLLKAGEVAQGTGIKQSKVGSKNGLRPQANLAKIENEIEARFLVPKSQLKSHISKSRRIKIRQFYISEKQHIKFFEQLSKTNPQILSMLLPDLKTVRLRAQKIDTSDTKYLAQFKTSKLSLSRTEISLPIDKSTFYKLIKLADDGYVSKTRFVRSSYFNLSGQREKVEAHIDFITALGLGKNRLSVTGLPDFLKNFAITELELPDEDSYLLIKEQNWGAFNFLNNSIDLQEIKSRHFQNLSLRSLPMGKVSKTKLEKIFRRVSNSG